LSSAFRSAASITVLIRKQMLTTANVVLTGQPVPFRRFVMQYGNNMCCNVLAFNNLIKSGMR
jgi:hypothetical protein